MLGQIIETGVSFILVMDFDQFRQIFEEQKSTRRMRAIQNNRWIVWLVLSLHIFSGCSTTRSVPEGDRLYLGAEVKWEGEKPGRSKELGETLVSLSRPSPNRKFLGMPVRLWLYNLGNKPTGKGLNYLLRNKWENRLY